MTEPEEDLVTGAILLITEKGLSLNKPNTLSVQGIYNYIRQ